MYQRIPTLSVLRRSQISLISSVRHTQLSVTVSILVIPWKEHIGLRIRRLNMIRMMRAGQNAFEVSLMEGKRMMTRRMARRIVKPLTRSVILMGSLERS